MASACTSAACRQQPASCSERGPWAAARRPLLPLPLLPPAAARRLRPCAALADEQRRKPVKQMEFVYMGAEEAAAAEAAAEAAWEQGMKEFADLQEWLLFRTWRFGLLFSGYLLFAASGEAAFCELLGAAAGYGYFKWLIADVSKLQPGDYIPMMEADKVEPQLARWAAKLFAAYRTALQPRLLVLPALLAAAAAYNAAAAPEDQLGLVEQGCLLGGFLSWKVALVLKIYEDLKPRPLTEEEILRQQRPMLVEVEDVKLDLRGIARKKGEEEQQPQQPQSPLPQQQAEGQPRT
ncbi:hypothetical protein ABPG75_002963 [Micractinium tetrahymenae]